MWWSRPLPWAIGVRPNSPPQIDQRVVEHAALLQVLDRARPCAWSTSLAATGDVVLDAAVVVPVAVVELDEAHAALGQPPGQQAVGRERAVAALRAVQVEGLLSARSTGPSAPGTLVCMRKAISYWLMRVAISGSSTASLSQPVERSDGVDHVALAVGVDAGRVAEVEDRVALGAELDALEAAGQKAAVPLPRGDRLRLAEPAGRGQHDEAGQVVALAAQAVGRPTSPSPAGRRWSCRCS